MTSVAPPICGGCQHLIRTSDRPLFDPKCDAFPAGIPWDILLSKSDHRSPFPGDRGVRFEGIDRESVEYAALMFATADPFAGPLDGD